MKRREFLSTFAAALLCEPIATIVIERAVRSVPQSGARVMLVASNFGFDIAAGAIVDGIIVKHYGGTSRLWGENWTSAEINSSEFGLCLPVS